MMPIWSCLFLHLFSICHFLVHTSVFGFPLIFILTFHSHCFQQKVIFLSHVTVSMFKQSRDIHDRLTAKQIDHHLICAHHDGRVGNLSDEMSGQAAVQRPVSLFLGYCEQSVEERAVLAAFLSQSCADHLCNQRRGRNLSYIFHWPLAVSDFASECCVISHS